MTITVQIIFCPFHTGIRDEAVGAGPDKILSRDLVPRLEAAGHVVKLSEISTPDPKQHVGDIGRSFDIMKQTSEAVSTAHAAGYFPLILAGNCNTTVGTVAGMGFGEGGQVPGGEVIWFDAHPDIDTPDETASGYFDVNGVAILAGQCWHRWASTIPGHKAIDMKKLTYVGLRDFDSSRGLEQVTKVKASGATIVWGGKDAPNEGFANGLESALDRDGGEYGDKPCVVHLDVDVLDTTVGIANFAAAPGGLTQNDALGCAKAIRKRRRPVAMTIASFDPSYEAADNIAEAAVQTVLALLT